MKTEMEIRAQLAALESAEQVIRVEAEDKLNAIANQRLALQWMLGELPEAQAPTGTIDDPLPTTPLGEALVMNMSMNGTSEHTPEA